MEQTLPPAGRFVEATPRPLASLLAGLNPQRWPGHYVFNSVADILDIDPADHIAIVREAEGWTLVTERSIARQQGLADRPGYAAITLEVDSALTDIGLTAAVSRVLAAAGIACNMLAGVHHDHLFIPATQADDALALLDELQSTHCPPTPPTDRP